MSSDLQLEEQYYMGEQQTDLSILVSQEPKMHYIHLEKQRKSVECQRKASTHYQWLNNKYPYYQNSSHRRFNNRNESDINERAPTKYQQKKKEYREKVRYRPKEEMEQKAEETVQEQKNSEEKQERSSSKVQEAGKSSIDCHNSHKNTDNFTSVDQCQMGQEPSIDQQDPPFYTESRPEVKQVIFIANTAQEGTVESDPTATLEQSEIKEVFIQKFQQPKVKKCKKPKSNKIFLFQTKSAQQSLQIEHYQPESIKYNKDDANQSDEAHLEVFDLMYFMKYNFRRVQVTFKYKGNIKVMRVKRFVVRPYKQANIRVTRDRNGNPTCNEQYIHYIQMLLNSYRGNSEYLSNYQFAKFPLCKIRLPQSAIVDTYEGQELKKSPILIDLLTITCGSCSKTFLCSKGLSCPECSIRLEINIHSVTIN